MTLRTQIVVIQHKASQNRRLSGFNHLKRDWEILNYLKLNGEYVSDEICSIRKRIMYFSMIFLRGCLRFERHS